VHWLQPTPDYPLTGDRVHDSFLEFIPTSLHLLTSQRNTNYRLDLFERVKI
jgi:hypothetical protein